MNLPLPLDHRLTTGIPGISDELVSPVGRNGEQAERDFSECTSRIGVTGEGAYTQTPAGEQDDDTVYVGFDTEWTRQPDLKRTNDVLAYGLVVVQGKERHEFYTEPADAKKRSRLSFKWMVGDALQGALRAGKIERWPDAITVAVHFGRGDLAACSDFKQLRPNLSAVKGTLGSGSGSSKLDYDRDDKSGEPVHELPRVPRGLQVKATDGSGNQHLLKVRFLDTINLAPEGSKSLDKLGALIGFTKHELPEGYLAADMRRFKAERFGDFKRYLLQDALITAKFAQMFAAFCRQELGIVRPSSTLAGTATKFMQLKWKEEGLHRLCVLGLQVKKSRSYSKESGRISIRGEEVLSFPRALTEIAAATAYRGGWTETFRTGPICAAPGEALRDIDLRSAYPLAMTAIGLPDFDTIRIVGPESLELFTANSLGFAEVTFKTPQSVRFPGIGVSTDRGLMFVRSGRAVVTAPEIAAARSLGVEITISHGVLLDWDQDSRLFQSFVVDLLNLRQRLRKDGQDTFKSLMVKTITNSLYGKLGQGVHERTAYDPRIGGSKTLPPSKVTQPILAAYTTGLVRAAISEMLNSMPAQRMAISVSTDGFLTDSRLDEISVAGPASQVLLDARRQIAELTGVSFLGGPSDLLEVKKEVREVLAFRNRGIATTETLNGSKNVTAKAGLKVPRGEDGNAYMAKLYMDRQNDTRVERKDLISLRDQMQHNADLVEITRNPRANLEPDFKRHIVLGWTATIQHGPHAGQSHLATMSEPYETVEDALRQRTLFEQWRDKTESCLKTIEDWESWQDHVEAATARKRGGRRVNVTTDGSIGVAHRQFLRALSHGTWGVATGSATFADIALWLTNNGFTTTVADLKNASRKGNDPVEGCCADTPEVRRLVAAVAPNYPDFQAYRLFPAGGTPDAGGA